MGSPKPRCAGGCGHVQHRDECGGKDASGGVPLLDPLTGEVIGRGCFRGARPQCRCPFGLCHTCGAVIVGAEPFPLGSAPEVDLDVDLAFAGALVPGDLAVRTLADGHLAVRLLDAGEDPGEGWVRARAHVHQLPPACPDGIPACPIRHAEVGAR